MQADHKKVLRLLKIAKGQIDGIIRLIDEDAYCVDISNQIIACEAILKKVNHEVLEAHLHHCVKDSFTNNDQEVKLDEVMSIIDKLIK